MENKELPIWASCWVINKNTGEIRPAVFDGSGIWTADESFEFFGSEWELYTTPEQDQENIKKVSLFLLAFVFLSISFFIYHLINK